MTLFGDAHVEAYRRTNGADTSAARRCSSSTTRMCIIALFSLVLYSYFMDHVLEVYGDRLDHDCGKIPHRPRKRSSHAEVAP